MINFFKYNSSFNSKWTKISIEKKKKKLSNALENVNTERVLMVCFLCIQAEERNANYSAKNCTHVKCNVLF